MKRIPCLMGIVAIMLMGSVTGFAQDDHPKFEVYGTYTIFKADIDVFNDETLHGWGAGVQWNPYKFLGGVAEFNGSYGSSRIPAPAPNPTGATVKIGTNVHSYLFGPRAYFRTKPVTVFAHSLFGFATLSSDSSISGRSMNNNEFAVALGGGVDVNINRGIAIRAAQFDYVPIHTDLPLNNGGSSYFRNTRYQAGVVFKF